MKTVPISYFGGGMADDYTNGGVGEFSVSKHFDILTYPYRLQPLRSMDVESVTDSKIGNIIVGSDGLMYGVGVDVSNPTLGTLWCRVGYGASDIWTQRGTNGSAGVKYPLLVEYKAQTNGRTMIYAVTGIIVAMNPTTGNADTGQTLSYTNIGQGFIHPKEPSTVYIPYDNKLATYIGATLSAAQFTIATQYQIPCLTNYNNLLAIPAYSGAGSGVYSSIVYLWDRDVSNTLPNDSIPWGQGQLKVLNNIGGYLIGISTLSANYNGSVQDSDAIQIKVWSGGVEPELIKEIKAQRLTTTAPSVTINPNVNFVYNNRLYFSANIVNGGTAPAYYGLWSVGKNKNGRWTVTVERMATDTGTETGVLAAAIAGDFVSTAHTTVGTLTYTANGSSLSSIYDATSVYESCINPEMDKLDREKPKQLMSVYCTYLPLPTDATVVMQYRVDSSANGAWTTIFTETGDGVTFTERTKAVSAEFTAGRKYEFRITSTDGAIITGWGYKYNTLTSSI